MLQPYVTFKEWELDMDRIRAHPQDFSLLRHVKSRVNVSSESIRRQVQEYLQDAAFASNPIKTGAMLAEKYNKVMIIKHPSDPWFCV